MPPHEPKTEPQAARRPVSAGAREWPIDPAAAGDAGLQAGTVRELPISRHGQLGRVPARRDAAVVHRLTHIVLQESRLLVGQFQEIELRGLRLVEFRLFARAGSLGVPSAPVTRATSGARAPSLPAFRMAITGTMQMKIAAKSFATSAIGPQAKPLALRYSARDTASEAKASARMTISRTRFCNSSFTPNTGISMPGFQDADSRIDQTETHGRP